MMTLLCASMLHVMVAFFPPALTFPENPNSIDSPLAWNPLSTGIGKLPPGSLRAWWDASKLNANDILWEYPLIPSTYSGCSGGMMYKASGTMNTNILIINGLHNGWMNHSPLFINGIAQPGLMLKIEGDATDTTYTVTTVLDHNRFVVSPNIQTSFSQQYVLLGHFMHWPDSSGYREHMDHPLIDNYSPSIYFVDAKSGSLYQNGHPHQFNFGQQQFTGIQTTENFSLSGQPVIVYELLVGTKWLSLDERTELEGYLAWKWGISSKLAYAHPYAHQAPESSGWQPQELGNALQLWVDANATESLFADSDCTQPAYLTGPVSCWKDRSNYGRNLYQNLNQNFPIYHQAENQLKSVYFSSASGPTPHLKTHDNATWLNNQNFFMVLVAQKLHSHSKSAPIITGSNPSQYKSGPITIGSNPFFPFLTSVCNGFRRISGSGNSASQWAGANIWYNSQKPAFLLQDSVRQKNFYKPYFNSHVQSSLITRSPPTYLHEQPYLLAVVADFLSVPSVSNPIVPILLGTIIPSFINDRNIYRNSYLGFGASTFTAGKMMLDQGWNTTHYQAQLAAGPSVYLLWKKEALKPPLLTINGIPDTINASGETGFLNIYTNQLNMLAMGDYLMGGRHAFSGNIYEAMVLTGPKIKYGHQRLIEGYLAWKWGLQHLLPRSHSYRRVPPAR
jgi:hypothetical protein